MTTNSLIKTSYRADYIKSPDKVHEIMTKLTLAKNKQGNHEFIIVRELISLYPDREHNHWSWVIIPTHTIKEIVDFVNYPIQTEEEPTNEV